MNTKRINTIHTENGEFVLDPCADYTSGLRFTALEGQFVGLGKTHDGEMGFCFWEKEENRVTILAIKPSQSLGLLMPMAGCESFVGRTTRLEARCNGAWTDYDVLVDGRRLDWITERIPPEGTFREIFIEQLSERVNTSAAR